MQTTIPNTVLIEFELGRDTRNQDKQRQMKQHIAKTPGGSELQ
jgi:hypothetical protein